MAFNITHIFDYPVTEDIVYPEIASGVCCERQSWASDDLRSWKSAEGTRISDGNGFTLSEHADVSAVFDSTIIDVMCIEKSTGGGRSSLADP